MSNPNSYKKMQLFHPNSTLLNSNLNMLTKDLFLNHYRESFLNPIKNYKSIMTVLMFTFYTCTRTFIKSLLNQNLNTNKPSK